MDRDLTVTIVALASYSYNSTIYLMTIALVRSSLAIFPFSCHIKRADQLNTSSNFAMNKKLLFLIPFIALLCILSVHLPDRFTPDLLVQGVQKEFPHDGCRGLNEILHQPFSYLGKGSQAIAFESADGKYVLKFFLTNRFHTGLRIRSPFKKKPPFRIRWDVLERYSTAFGKIQEETALVGIHLSSITTDLPHCTLIDPQGYHHVIDLNKFSFLVQKKCLCLSDHFTQLSSDQKHHLTQELNALLISLAHKGFNNLRGSFKEENFAFCDDKAYVIDIGNFTFQQTTQEHPDGEIQRSTQALSKWLQTKK